MAGVKQEQSPPAWRCQSSRVEKVRIRSICATERYSGTKAFKSRRALIQVCRDVRRSQNIPTRPQSHNIYVA